MAIPFEEAGQGTSTPSPILGYREIAVDTGWQKRQYRQIALDAALKLSTTAEPEKRLVERARVIFDFLYGEDK